MIIANNITKSFGSLQVLKGVNLQVKPSEIVSIMGASGAGKTTLLQILGTLETPDSGSVVIDGVDVGSLRKNELSHFRNKKIGFVFQFHQLLPEFSALENVMIPALIGGASFSKAEKSARELLTYLDLTNRVEHKPSQLSGGEKQRVAVARALVNRPAVILADEPSGSLDSKNKEDLNRLFFDLRKNFNQTLLIVTHDKELASIADRMINIKDGVIEQND
ncbi:MAG: ABC transporter ATP-binding protein [Paludibacteraceae bacterium]|jgi:lipoprotein-releasing system ATP-binding protein|nr:ABC transporter ATP-binding protein [Paludibacteraceae bacterium]MDI9536599.1 ABC transporter ATP-binding protein [Bacteroidota bacterium]OQC34766.1 MAG: Lipoprotein-releasing system ATP-binding protein LolD [Bacteroidetes bacterium ADurb.Bin057]HHT60742.1 ABC transporter ATP-binding protein [Bacteroidales bacterium]MBP9038762.1 ABC transporter ATP-binding protein [Paludibacteraceae bacterium]